MSGSLVESGRISQKSVPEESTKVNNRARKWLMKLNDVKSAHVDFTNQRCQHIPITINYKDIPHSSTAKYLGMTLDATLRWKPHVKKKREDLGLKYRKMYWLIGRRLILCG